MIILDLPSYPSRVRFHESEENQLRKTYGFDGTPIRFKTKPTEQEGFTKKRKIK